MDEYYPENNPKDFEHRRFKYRERQDDNLEDMMETPDNYLRICFALFYYLKI